MAIVKRRAAAKKLGHTPLGHKIVRFKTKNNKRTFSVHENLACANSKFFKKRLQKHRKAFGGECAICHEDLNPRKSDITFCRGYCGQNIHEECITQWTQTHSSCPLCREVWQLRSEEQVELHQELDNDAVQLYLDWIYTKSLAVLDELNLEKKDYVLCLFKAWYVSDAMEDLAFRHALAAELVSIDVKNVSATTIKYIYGPQFYETFLAAKGFVADWMLAAMEPQGLGLFLAQCPMSFAQVICYRVLTLCKDRPVLTDVLKQYTKGAYEMETPENVDAEVSGADASSVGAQAE